MNSSIIIPVYKSEISKQEEISLRKCFYILSSYDIYIITFKDLEISLYKNIAKEYNKEILFEFFEDKYFSSLFWYNKLMMSEGFYKRFIKYKYILIYQLDAYVFNDNLDYWTSLDYDYIGAPWFEDFLSYEDGKPLWKVGNGGLSLRKVSKFIEIISNKEIKYNFKFYYKYFSSFYVPKWKKILNSIISAYFFQYKVNEDYFLIYIAERQNNRIKIPDINTSISFAFERSPSYLYKLNNNTLPFGCHAFEKNEFESFWKPFIF